MEKYPVKVAELSKALTTFSILELQVLRSILIEKESQLIISNTVILLALLTIIQCLQEQVLAVLITDKEDQIQELVDHL